MLGRNISLLMPEPHASRHDEYLERYQRTGEARIIGIGRQVQAKHADGTVFPVELSVGEARSAAGRRYVGIMRDLREKLAAEREAAEMRERLAHVSRLHTMGETASGIAHEINQPLAALVNYAEAARRLLEREPPAVEQARQALLRIAEQAQRAGEIIQRLRLFFKRRGGERRPADLNEVIRDAVALNRSDTRCLDHPVELVLAEDLPSVVVDEVQIQQVLINLLRNALDAVADQPGAALRIVSRREGGDRVAVEVIDSGPGIPEDVAAHLFDPFFTTKRDGMGMGLPISESIVRAHGGRLVHEHRDGMTVFRFTLPASLEDDIERGRTP
ncbi:MAG: hypothetical protein KatS3mg121_1333 [Gammaproteobacteria bacterium]|nr:MAG: hypothetical protein KatS3mg121_1333 [Gammaproteobacteria bacterium]